MNYNDRLSAISTTLQQLALSQGRDRNTLERQLAQHFSGLADSAPSSVMLVFETEADRDAALPTPKVPQLAYITSGPKVTRWTGKTWVTDLS